MAKNTTNRFKYRVISIYLVILGLSIAISYFVYQTSHNISNVHHRLSEIQLPLLNNISELEHWLNEHERLLYEHYATEDNSRDQPRIKFAQQQIAKNLQNLRVAIANENNRLDLQMLNRMNLLSQEIIRNAVQAIRVLDSTDEDKWDRERDLLAKLTDKGQQIKPAIDELKGYIERQISSSNSRSNKQLNYMSNYVGLFSVVIFLIAILVGYYLIATIRSSFEKRRLALFIEKSPNPIAAVSWDGEIKFRNVSWRKKKLESPNNNFYKQLKSQLLAFSVKGSNFSQWHYHYLDEDLEIEMRKIDMLNQVMVFVENISERVLAQQKLEFLAYNDPLTGLPNSKKLELDLDEQLNKDASHNFYLFTIGMNRLKLVASTHGYSVSNVLMKALIKRLEKDLSSLNKQFEFCQLYRFTGAKFSVLLAKPKQVVDRIRLLSEVNRYLIKAMDEPLNTEFGNFFLDFQTGCTIYPEHGLSSKILMKNSNTALTVAQKDNSKQVVLFDQKISELEQCWYQLENDLRAADFAQQLYLLYQPKVCLQSNKMLSMEALVRWNHPKKGLISPVQFIPIAEESGTILRLGHWIMTQAVDQTKRWHDEGFDDLQVAVNVSPSQLLSADFISNVKDCLLQSGLEPRYLEIEITEEVLAKEQDTCIEVLNSIRQLGISIAVDDFGTGYSSLGYLNRFPLSKLKIDRSFVTNIHQDNNNYAIVSAIISLSKNLGVRVIAEGIENQQQLDVLVDLGCDIGQGYLFDKPLSIQDFSNHYGKMSLSTTN